MYEFCANIHQLARSQQRYQFHFDQKEIPRNGIYLLFERGEEGHDGERIVRVGTHTGVNQLRSRLKQHFIQTNKDRSIFRKNVGRCILNRSNDPYLKLWELDLTTSAAKKQHGHLVDREYQNQIEAKVSQYIQEHFSFCVLEVHDKEERLFMEARLISTISLCERCKASKTWIGLSSPVEKIRTSGLWQVNELYKEPLSERDYRKLVELV